MIIFSQKLRSPFSALVVLLIFRCAAVPLRGQSAPPRPALIVTPLGETADPKMMLFQLDLIPGVTMPGRAHDKAIFAYVIEGEVEAQSASNAPEVFRTGAFFNQPAGKAQLLLRNTSKIAPARILVSQNSASLPQGVKPLLQSSLTDLADLEVTFGKIVSAPGDPSPPPHQHPGPAFAYLMKGQVQSQVDPDEPEIYHAGEVFSESPTRVHRFYRNLSKTESAELLLFVVRKKAQASSQAAK